MRWEGVLGVRGGGKWCGLPGCMVGADPGREGPLARWLLSGSRFSQGSMQSSGIILARSLGVDILTLVTQLMLLTTVPGRLRTNCK